MMQATKPLKPREIWDSAHAILNDLPKADPMREIASLMLESGQVFEMSEDEKQRDALLEHYPDNAFIRRYFSHGGNVAVPSGGNIGTLEMPLPFPATTYVSRTGMVSIRETPEDARETEEKEFIILLCTGLLVDNDTGIPCAPIHQNSATVPALISSAFYVSQTRRGPIPVTSTPLFAYGTNVRANHSFFADEINDECVQVVSNVIGGGVAMAHMHTCYVNLPNSYIVREYPSDKTRRKAKPGSERQWHARTRHVILTPGEVHERWHTHHAKSGRGTPKMPHMRRGHFRTLSGDRWTEEKRGTRVWVRAHAVNGADVSWFAGGIRYRVV